MNKRNVPVFKNDKRLGVNIFGLTKSPLNRNFKKNVRSGKIRKSNYNERLSEKQKVKAFYGASESYFNRILERADKIKNSTESKDIVLIFFQMLESRLDNALRRSCFTKANGFGRQLINHKHILVNGKIVNIPSYHLKVGDVISLNPNKRNEKLIKACQDNIVSCQRHVPKDRYEIDNKNLAIKFLSLPKACKDIKYDFHLDHVKAVSFLLR